ncbi:MAG: hypothetical protein ACR2NR_10360 [Solirubrobacteraceae bacterium]
MQGAFATVVWVVCAVGIVGAVVGLLLNRRTWDEYGKDHLLLDSEQSRARPGAARSGGAVAAAERDEEVRQMLEARNARRRRRGEPAIDVERELSRLTAPAVDDELREEIRELVIARNHRRARRGEPALDVDAEVERQIAELSSR